MSTAPWTIGRQSKRHELTVEDGEIVNVIKPGDPRRLRITKEDIERVRYSDGGVGCSAIRAAKPAQRQSEYCRRRVEEDLKVSEEGRQRPEKAEERFTAALVRAGERIETLGTRASMHRDEDRASSAAAQAGES